MKHREHIFFVYKEKRYPFNITLFNLFSLFFKNPPLPIKENINLVDLEDNIDISESIIYDFINFCQNNKIKLNKDECFIIAQTF